MEQKPVRKPNQFRFTKKFMTADGYGKKYRLRSVKTFGGSPTWHLYCPDGNTVPYKSLNLFPRIPSEIKEWVYAQIGLL